MRFMTIKVYRTFQFYGIVSTIMTFEEKIEDDNKYREYGISTQKSFERHARGHFSDDILYADEVKELIFDGDGNVRQLNCLIYEKLQKLAIAGRSYAMEKWDKLHEANKYIQEADVNSDIIELAKGKLHDSRIMSLEFKNGILEMYIQYRSTFKIYMFELRKDLSIDYLKEFVGDTILYEEVFIDFEKPKREYSILTLRKTDQALPLDLHELTIEFRLFKMI